MFWGRSHAVLGAVLTALVVSFLAVTAPAHAAPPANDDVADAQVLTGSPVTVTGTLVDATAEQGEPGTAEDPDQHSVWYAWTAPADDRFVVTSSLSLTVLTGDSLSSLGEVSDGAFDADAGVTYYIIVRDGYAWSEFSLSIRRSASIEGRVVDASGAGISGVEVRTCRSLSSCVRTDGITDSTGHYRVNDLGTGTYHVQFVPTDNHVREWYGDAHHRNDAVDLEVTAETRLTGMNAELAVGRTISGTVTGVEGGPAATSVGGCLWEHDENRCPSPLYVGAVAEDGTYVIDGLPPGDFLVRFRADDDHIDEWYIDKPSITGATFVSVPADSDVAGIDAQLAGYGSIAGRVVNRIGEGLRLDSVDLYRLEDGRFSFADKEFLESDGSFTFDDLRPGSYKLGLSSGRGWYDGASDESSATEITVADSADLVGLDVEAQPERSIIGTVTDPDAQGIPQVGVKACPVDAASEDCDGYGDVTNSDGSFLITPPAGTYKLYFRGGPNHHGEWYSDSPTADVATPVTIDADAPHLVADAELTPKSAISGAVRDGSGAVLAGVEVHLEACWTGSYGSRKCEISESATTDDSGAYEFGGLGEFPDYRIKFSSPDHRDEWYDDHFEKLHAKEFQLGRSEHVTGVDAELLTQDEWKAANPCGGLAATIIGTDGDDELTGTDGPDVIHGLGGDDVIRGLDGDDVFCGGAGSDIVGGGGHDDRIFASRGHDIVRSGWGADVVNGGGGNDRLYGGAGSDVVRGGPGRDRVQGDSGADRLAGGHHRDRLVGGPGRDVLAGQGGNDVLVGGAAPDRLRGQSGHDRLVGNDGNDRLDGGYGQDWCAGLAGRDVGRRCEPFLQYR